MKRLYLLTCLLPPVVDGVPFLYPAKLYQPEGSPLHFLQKLRDYDLNTYNDPLIQDFSKYISTIVPSRACMRKNSVPPGGGGLQHRDNSTLTTYSGA